MVRDTLLPILCWCINDLFEVGFVVVVLSVLFSMSFRAVSPYILSLSCKDRKAEGKIDIPMSYRPETAPTTRDWPAIALHLYAITFSTIASVVTRLPKGYIFPKSPYPARHDPLFFTPTRSLSPNSLIDRRGLVYSEPPLRYRTLTTDSRWVTHLVNFFVAVVLVEAVSAIDVDTKSNLDSSGSPSGRGPLSDE